MWEVARRPRWIGVLFVCLAIAAAFAALGQWQLSRAVDTGVVALDRETEKAVPLESVAAPQQTATTLSSGQKVSFGGILLPDDYVILEGRFNGGVEGYWVVGHMLINTNDRLDGTAPSLAVGLGWAASKDDAEAAVGELRTLDDEIDLTGRFVTTEPPQEDDFETGELKSASVASLVNLWATPANSVYGGYVVSDDSFAGLDVIDSPPPVEEVTLNWLNVFYAIEWAVFAGFAVFLWFRLVKDEWEREQDDEEGELN